MDKNKILTWMISGLMIAVSVALCVFVFFIEPPFAWLTSALFAAESLLFMALAMLKKSAHYKVEFYASLATFVCFVVLMILEMF